MLLQELQSLIDEANQSLEESGTPSHEIMVIVLHREFSAGTIGITLAGGPDYECKEITVILYSDMGLFYRQLPLIAFVKLFIVCRCTLHKGIWIFKFFFFKSPKKILFLSKPKCCIWSHDSKRV